MNWEAIGAVGEVLGAIGVITTLVYLAVQIRQNTESQRTDSYARALDRVTALQARMSENSAFASILLRGVTDGKALTQEERVQFTWIFYEMFSGFEFIFHQDREGSLPPGVWERWAATLCWWLSFPGVRAWWTARPTPFTPDFTQFVNGRLDAAPRTPLRDQDAQDRWTGYLRGED
jgi:hypothetical protein